MSWWPLLLPGETSPRPRFSLGTDANAWVMYALGISLCILLSHVLIPSCGNFTHLWDGNQWLQVLLWGTGRTSSAADAVVPSLLWQCSSSGSAGSRQLSEISGRIKKEQDVFPI